MTLKFIQQINEYVIGSIFEANDQEVLSRIDSSGYPTSDDIANATQLIQQVIQEEKRRRLTKRKAEFAAYKASQEFTQVSAERRSVSAMIADIATALQNKDEVPQGILLAFRDQQDHASDEDIVRIWESLVELGLIDPDDKDSTP